MAPLFWDGLKGILPVCRNCSRCFLNLVTDVLVDVIKKVLWKLVWMQWFFLPNGEFWKAIRIFFVLSKKDEIIWRAILFSVHFVRQITANKMEGRYYKIRCVCLCMCEREREREREREAEIEREKERESTDDHDDHHPKRCHHEKSTRDLKRLAVAQIPLKDTQQTMVWKTLIMIIVIIIKIIITSRDYPNYSIAEIGQNTEKSPIDLKILAITQTPVKDHQLTLVGKIRRE